MARNEKRCKQRIDEKKNSCRIKSPQNKDAGIKVVMLTMEKQHRTKCFLKMSQTERRASDCFSMFNTVVMLEKAVMMYYC